MDKDLQKIDQKIDKLAQAMEKGFGAVDKRFGGLEQKFGGLEQNVEILTETVTFMKDQMVTKTELKEEVAKLATKDQFKMLEGHLNVIEQKLDVNIEKHKDLEVRVTHLESAPAQ